MRPCAVDVAVDPMPVQTVADPKRPLQVHLPARAKRPERGPPQRFAHGGYRELGGPGKGRHGLADTVDGDGGPGTSAGATRSGADLQAPTIGAVGHARDLAQLLDKPGEHDLVRPL